MIARSKDRRAFRVAAFLLAACAVMLSGCGKQEPPLRIGFLGGLSGRVADLGVAGRNGAQLAVDQRNQAGGINGRPVELLVRDDQQDLDLARQAVREMIEARVAAIVGPMTSAMAIAALPVAEAAGVLLLSPTATTSDLTGKDDHFLRVIAPTGQYARQNARHLRQTLKLSRVAAVYDASNRSYTESWLRDFRADFEANGGNLASTVTFRSGADVAFDVLARTLVDSGADGILILANSLDTAMLCQQIRKLDARIPIAASEWSATERLVELGGAAVEGISIGQFVDRDNTEPAYVAFRKAYLERFGQEPGYAGVTAYDATNVVLEALARTRDGRPLKQVILAAGEFQGLQDPIRFDRFGDSARRTVLTTVRGGRFVPVGTP